MTMPDDRTDLLDEIGRALAVTPSPDFRGARPSEIAARRRPVWLPNLWRWQMATAAIAIAAGVAFMMRGAPHGTPTIAERPRGEETSAASDRPDIASTNAVNGSGPNIEVARPTRVVPPRPKPTAVTATDRAEAVETTGPDLTVVTNQPALLRRLREQSFPLRRWPALSWLPRMRTPPLS